MRLPRLPSLKPYLPYVQGVTLVVLAVVGIANFVSLREQLYQGVRRPIEERLDDRVRSWEDSLLDRLRVALRSAAEQPEAAATAEASIRAELPYVESILLWDPIEPTGRIGGRSAARVLHPQPIATNPNVDAPQHPCITSVQPLQYAPGAEPRTIAAAYLSSCAATEPAVRLEAALEAARALEGAGLLDDAAAALRAAGLPDDLSLRAGLRANIAADRLIVFFHRQAELAMARGLEQQAIDRYLQTGLEIAELPAPDAVGLETWRWSLLEELRQHARDRAEARLQIAFDALDRRLRAYAEVRNQLAPEVAVGSREPRLIRDQYVERSYLLFYGVVERADGRRVGVALQLDEARVLANFLADAESDRGQLVVVDPSGRWVMGKRGGAGEVSVLVPFARTLPHYRVGVYDEYVQARMRSLRGQWLVPLVFTAIVLLIGIVALSAQIGYARDREELLVRQREFTTRVTHELKTPLAGIKVMAENLESGVVDGEVGQRRTAARIVQEADRLTERIEELLRFARRREVPDPERFDLDEVAFELAEVWAPRMEEAGVRFEVDVEDPPPILGDPIAVRDAIGALLDNALKYRRPDHDEPLVLLTVTRDGRDAVITVLDNGLGVPPGQRARIFERFVRVEGPNRGLAGGHGLGLSQVADTARAHRGSVVCHAGIDGGSSFVLRLRGEVEPS